MKISKKRRGFTLIEMLVVVAIIMILSGIVLKATALVLRHMGMAKARADLEHIQNALNEYYKEYGSYPPCTDVTYQYEGAMTRAQHNFELFLKNPMYNRSDSSNRANFFADARRTYPGGVTDAGFNNQTLNYNYGLISYLWPRRRPLDPTKPDDRVHFYEMDTERDFRAKNRWAPFLADVKLSYRGSDLHYANIGSSVPYTNDVNTIYDPWHAGDDNPPSKHDYRYLSRAPFESYKLWCVGPDGVDGTTDDINVDSVRRQ